MFTFSEYFYLLLRITFEILRIITAITTTSTTTAVTTSINTKINIIISMFFLVLQFHRVI
jgi:hypothetical protein